MLRMAGFLCTESGIAGFKQRAGPKTETIRKFHAERLVIRGKGLATVRRSREGL